MSEHQTSVQENHPSDKSLWPVAAVILLVVFMPAFLAWALTLIHH
jgi:hypothetical protein